MCSSDLGKRQVSSGSRWAGSVCQTRRSAVCTAENTVKGKDRMSVELNHYLEITRSHVHQIYRELETSGKIITVDLVRKLFYGVDEDNKTLLQVFREHNEQSRKLIGKDFVSKTVQRYETCLLYTSYGGVPIRLGVEVIDGVLYPNKLYLGRAKPSEVISQIKKDLETSLQ